jgi:fucose permease
LLPLFTASFLCFGTLIVLVGANQAELARTLALDLEQTGMLGAALALGAGAGIAAAGPLVDRLPRRPLFAAAALLCALPLLTVRPGTSYAEMLVRVLVTGLGGGLYNTTVNAVLSSRPRAAATRALAVVHGAATVGAIGGPMLYGWATRRHDWTVGLQIIGAAHVALAAAAALVPIPGPGGGEPRAERVPLAGLGPYAVLLFCYVGIEVGSTNFAVPYAIAELGLDAERGRAAISALWAGVLAMRVLLYLVPALQTPRALAGAGLASTMVVAAGVAARPPIVELFFGAIGLAIGVVYPLTMALLGERFVAARGTATGLAGGAGALGAVLVPWLTGALGDRSGVGVAVGSLAVWGAGLALMAVLLPRSAPA